MRIAKRRKRKWPALTSTSAALTRRLRTLRGEATQADFAKELTAARHRLGILSKRTREGQAGEIADIDASRVSEWESGKNALGFGMLRIYQTATKASLDWIVLGVGPDGKESAEPVYLGSGWPKTQLQDEITSYARQRLTARVAAGDFDDLMSLSDYGVSASDIRALASELPIDSAALLAQLEGAAVALGRETAWRLAWENHLDAAQQWTDKARTQRGRQAALGQERAATFGLLRNAHHVRILAELKRIIPLKSERRFVLDSEKRLAEMDRHYRKVIRKAQYPERYAPLRKTKPPRQQQKPAGR